MKDNEIKSTFLVEVSFRTTSGCDLEKVKFDIFNYLNKKAKKRFKKSGIKTKISFPKGKK